VGQISESQARGDAETRRQIGHGSASRSFLLSRSLSLDRALPYLLALGAFLLYLRTLAPGILDGDSGEWQYMANILGVAHSTGYPLYLLVAKAFTIIPVGSPAWRVNLVSAVCAALSLPFIYLLGRRLSGSRTASFVAASLFAVAPTLWASAVEAEVYALNTLLLSLTLYLALRWYDAHNARDLYLAAFAFGLALDNHRVSLFIAPALLLLAWLTRRWLTPRRLAASTIMCIMPLLLYLYIPIRASQLLADQSPANWQLYPRAEAMLKGTISAYYNNTPYGVFNLITGFDNRNKLGFQDTNTDSLTTRIGNSFALLLEQFNPIVLLFVLGGFLLLLRRDRRLTLFLTLWAAGISGISLVLRAESTRFYFSGAYLVLALFFAAAAGELLKQSQTRSWQLIATTVFLVALPLISLLINFHGIDESGFNDYENYARSILGDNLAANGVVIAPWEIATGLRYLQFVDGLRPDLLVIHESPVRPQFQKLLTSAHTLNRPFYYVQFTPEDRSVEGVRTVQAVGLPILTKPVPKYSLDLRLTSSVRVVGYDLSPDPPLPGGEMRLMVYYQVVAPVSTQFVAGLDLTDIRGEPHGDWEHAPVSLYDPTYLWKVGDYYRDVWDIPLPVDAPKGLYGLGLTWYAFDSATNATDYENGQSITFGPIRIGDFDPGKVAASKRADFENGMTLKGYGLHLTGGASINTNSSEATPISIQTGKPITVSLYWEASRKIPEAYTVFVHLEDTSGAVRAQSDRPPWDGMYPTDRWSIGETVRDDYMLQLPDTLPAGDYVVRVGVYRSADKRIPLVSGGDEFTLVSKIRLSGE
jgi:hypothetical protein